MTPGYETQWLWSTPAGNASKIFKYTHVGFAWITKSQLTTISIGIGSLKTRAGVSQHETFITIKGTNIDTCIFVSSFLDGRVTFYSFFSTTEKAWILLSNTDLFCSVFFTLFYQSIYLLIFIGVIYCHIPCSWSLAVMPSRLRSKIYLSVINFWFTLHRNGYVRKCNLKAKVVLGHKYISSSPARTKICWKHSCHGVSLFCLRIVW